MVTMRSITPAFLLLVLMAAAASACGDSPTAPRNVARFSQTDLVVGTGAEAAAGKMLTVHYTGWLYNESRTDQKGAQFDSSVGRTPLTFTLGAGQVIQGWEQGFTGMKAGGKRRLVIPPSLAYGGTRRGPIPPNATLIFEIDLIAVQ